VVLAKPNAVTNGALRIHVDDERLESTPRECRGQIHRGGRLADATLLTDDGEN